MSGRVSRFEDVVYAALLHRTEARASLRNSRNQSTPSPLRLSGSTSCGLRTLEGQR